MILSATTENRTIMIWNLDILLLLYYVSIVSIQKPNITFKTLKKNMMVFYISNL